MRPNLAKADAGAGEKAPQHPADAPPPAKRGWFSLRGPAAGSAKSSDERSDSSSERYAEAVPAQAAPTQPPSVKKKEKKRKFTGKLRTDMIKRVEGGGFGVNPMGWYHQDADAPIEPLRARADTLQLSAAEPAANHTQLQTQSSPAGILENPQSAPAIVSDSEAEPARRRSSEHAPPRRISLDPQSAPAQMEGDEHDPFPRSKTIAFNDADHDVRVGQRNALQNAREAQANSQQGSVAGAMHGSHGTGTGYMPRTGTIRPAPTGYGLDRSESCGRQSTVRC